MSVRGLRPKGQAGQCATSPCSLPANRGELRTVCQILDRPAPKQLYGHLCQASPSLSYGRLDPFFCPEPSYTDTRTTRPDPMLATGVINRRCQKTVPLVGEISVTEKWDSSMFGGVRRGRRARGGPRRHQHCSLRLGHTSWKPPAQPHCETASINLRRRLRPSD